MVQTRISIFYMFNLMYCIVKVITISTWKSVTNINPENNSEIQIT